MQRIADAIGDSLQKTTILQCGQGFRRDVDRSDSRLHGMFFRRLRLGRSDENRKQGDSDE